METLILAFPLKMEIKQNKVKIQQAHFISVKNKTENWLIGDLRGSERRQQSPVTGAFLNLEYMK